MINDSKSFLFDIDFMDEAIKDLEDSGKQIKEEKGNDYTSPDETPFQKA